MTNHLKYETLIHEGFEKTLTKFLIVQPNIETKKIEKTERDKEV